MSDIPSAQELFGQGQAQSSSPFKIGTVTALFTSPAGTAKIRFDGEEEASEKKYSYLASYKPTVGDRVLLAAVSGTYIIVDKIMHNQSPPSSANLTVARLTVNDDAVFNDIVDINSTLEVSGKVTLSGEIEIDGNLNHDGSSIGFFGTTPTYKRTVYYAETSDASIIRDRLNSLIQVLGYYGLITPSN